MRKQFSHCLLFGLLIAWALSHATVFGQPSAKPTGGDRLRQGLDKIVTVDYTGQSLSEALNHLRDKTGLAITIDQNTVLQLGVNPDDNVGQVQIKATSEKASQVLRKMLMPYGLTYVVFEDAVLITTEEMAIVRQMRQRVSVDLEDVPFRKAIRELARAHGINVVLDPKVMKQVDTPVSLQIDNTGVETTIRLLAELASLKAVRMGNVMFVTSEDKARKIRDEESHQYDNLLNPNLAGVAMPALFGGAGIGRAVGRGPANALPAIPEMPVPANPPVPPQGVESPAAPDTNRNQQEAKSPPKKQVPQ